MSKTYRIKGLCCANCALSLEKKLKKVPGVSECQINFLSETMVIEHDQNSLDSIKEICSNFEDGVDIKRIK